MPPVARTVALMEQARFVARKEFSYVAIELQAVIAAHRIHFACKLYVFWDKPLNYVGWAVIHGLPATRQHWLWQWPAVRDR